MQIMRLAPAILGAALLLAAPAARAERVFVSNEKDNTITVLDGGTLAVTATVQVGDRPRGIVASPTAAASTSAPATATTSRCWMSRPSP